MKTQRKFLLLISIILVLILACNIAPTPPANSPQAIETSVAATLIAAGQPPPAPPQPDAGTAPTATLPPSMTPIPTLTPTITLTPTPTVPMVSVSIDTNCRTGPGKIYDYIGALMVGEKAEVVGKRSSHNYWIIKNPDAPGECWLWGQYATVAGNTANLPEYPVPPTPTPTFTPTPVIPTAPTNLSISKTCLPLVLPQYQLTIILSWDDASNNEDGFNIYQNGTLLQSLAANSTQATYSIPIAAGVPMEYGVEAYNTTGASARPTITAVCP